jgi:hypothetical protein
VLTSVGVLALLAALVLSACGGGGKRQDADETEGRYPVKITNVSFPNRQRLAQRSELRIGVKNVGQQEIPNLAITLFTDPNAERPFSIRADVPNAANPNRAVWVLENGYPKLAGTEATAGASTANLDTFQFGPLQPGASKDIVWLLSPVRPGTYTLTYAVAAGLNGKAVAVNEDGSKPGGKFLVKIAGTPPDAGVNDKGEVVIKGPNGTAVVEKNGKSGQEAPVGSGGTSP